MEKEAQILMMKENKSIELPHFNQGRKFSEEHKRKISNALTGRTLLEEHNKNIRLAQTGMKRSEEICKRISTARMVALLYIKLNYIGGKTWQQ